MTMKKQLSALFFEHDANRVDKWEHYLGMYQSELAPFIDRGSPVRLLEIGVRNGGSLELWSKFLPPGSIVRGIDIDERIEGLTFESSNIAAMVGDATDRSHIERLFGNDTFDIIIDDGSHCSSDVISSFRWLYEHLSPGGKYVIEDLHCSYRPSYKGGYRVNHSSVEWLKHLIDALNADHIPAIDRIPAEDKEIMAAFRTSVARVTFYDSVAVVEKLRTEKVRPYRRLISGRDAQVRSDEEWLATEPLGKFEPMLLGQPAARQIEATLITSLTETRSRIAHLGRELDEARRLLMHREAETSEALAQRETVHRQELLAGLETYRAALGARERAYQQELQKALDAREAATLKSIGATLATAARIRNCVRAGAGNIYRWARRALR